MLNLPVTFDNPRLRLLGRMDPSRLPAALDWTGSGLECAFRGSDIWAELEAPALSPILWMIVLADGFPVARFPVEPGIRFYPLLLGMSPENVRTVTLLKETQCMPDAPEEVVRRYNLALVQGLLLNAGELVVTVPEAASPAVHTWTARGVSPHLTSIRTSCISGCFRVNSSSPFSTS